jgi:hypothetical protein
MYVYCSDVSKHSPSSSPQTYHRHALLRFTQRYNPQSAEISTVLNTFRYLLGTHLFLRVSLSL